MIKDKEKKKKKKTKEKRGEIVERFPLRKGEESLRKVLTSRI